MSDEVHEPQASPGAPEVVDVLTLAEVLLRRARSDANGRASHLAVNGPVLRAHVIALASGSALGEHDSPRGATLHVLRGRGRLHTREHSWVVGPGEVVPIPPQR